MFGRMDAAGMWVLVALICLYFLPWIVAHNRQHPAVDGILILDLFLGWTVIGWVIALAWACSRPPVPRRA